MATFGDKPAELNLQQIDFGKLFADQAKQIGENLGEAQGIAGDTSKFNLSQMFAALERFSPGITEYAKSAFGGAAEADLKAISGELGQDEMTQLNRSNAYATLRGGISGSQAGQNRGIVSEATARLNKMMGAMGSGQRWTGMAQSMTSPVNFNVNSMFVPLEQRMNYLSDYYAKKAEVDQYNAEIAAAPSPWGQAVLNASMQSLGAAGGYAAGYGGGAGGSFNMPKQDYFGGGAGWGITSSTPSWGGMTVEGANMGTGEGG